MSKKKNAAKPPNAPPAPEAIREEGQPAPVAASAQAQCPRCGQVKGVLAPVGEDLRSQCSACGHKFGA